MPVPTRPACAEGVARPAAGSVRIVRALLLLVFAAVFVVGSQLLTSTVLMHALFLALCRLEDSWTPRRIA